jgi:hypothetical protein
MILHPNLPHQIFPKRAKTHTHTHINRYVESSIYSGPIEPLAPSQEEEEEEEEAR